MVVPPMPVVMMMAVLLLVVVKMVWYGDGSAGSVVLVRQ